MPLSSSHHPSPLSPTPHLFFTITLKNNGDDNNKDDSNNRKNNNNKNINNNRNDNKI